jgi:tRNA nucleotidyltransferase (CCA-adding enzyme)
VPARAYPQVEPGAEALVDVSVGEVAAGAAAGEALRAARRRDAGVVRAGDAYVVREDLVRASRLGLEDLPAHALARPLPVVDVRTAEIAVRRHLAAGARYVVVADRRGPVGAVGAPAAGSMPGPSLGPRFERRLPPPLRALIAGVRAIAESFGVRVFLAGGTVRDALRGDEPGLRRDVDLVVEGDGLQLARALAGALGGATAGRLVEHERFLTASLSVEGVGRVDVATSRSERYEEPGALPHVLPAPIAQDLGRRDFTVNAMAVELASGAHGLLDPFGGRRALARRRLSVLHPLSFVEDPTRIFRAARYAARLGFAVDAWTLRAQALAVRLGAYPALSGRRLLTELELIVAEPGAPHALARLGRAGALRLLDSRYRFGRATAARLRDLAGGLAWSRGVGLAVPAVELGLLALVADQAPGVARAVAVRLGLEGERLGRLERARTAPPPAPAGAPGSERARRLRDRADVELAWLWLAGNAAQRAEIEWFVRVARDVRPLLGGEEVVRLGVPRGPGVARALGALRDARLDGRVRRREEEAAFVRDFAERREEG